MKAIRKAAGYLLVLCCMLMLCAVPVQAAAPGKTKITKISVKSTSALEVVWQKVSGASGYEVYRKTGAGTFQKAASVSGAGYCAYTDKKLKADTLYTYQVRAYRSENGKKQYSEFSSAKSARTAAEVTSIALEKAKTIRTNQTVKLRMTVYPANASSARLTWSSSNPSVASVSGGKVTGLSAGDAVITVRSSNGKKAFCKVTVGITKTTTYDEFGKAIAELSKESRGQGISEQAAASNKYCLKRLIVKTTGGVPDFSKVKARAVVKGPENTYVVQFGSSAATEYALKTIEKWSGIVYVEPDLYESISSGESGNIEFDSFNDPGSQTFSEGWLEQEAAEEDDAYVYAELSSAASDAMDSALSNMAQSRSWGVAKIGAAAYAKRVSSKTSATIRVAVVDSGVDATHPFIRSRVISGGYDFIDNDSYPNDYHGHGTHVSGTIVDCTPGLNVKILPVRVLDEEGRGSSSAVASGIRYAANHGAKVINLSLSGGHSHLKDDAINYAIRKGVTVVVAAGNEYTNIQNASYGEPGCPAHMKNVICVGAVDSSNRRADFSNYGSTLDLVAPGVGISSSIPGGYYDSWDGTSMATPHVAALAAIMKLANPSMSPARIEAALKNHCKDLGSRGWDQYYGYGIPNFVSSKSIAVTKVTLSKTSVSIQRGKKCTLKATVAPSNATNKKITWISSNTSVATVSGGVVTAKKAGTATITAKSSNGKRATCRIKVVNAAPTKLPAPVTTLRRMDQDGWINIMWNPVSGASGYRVQILNYSTGKTGVQYLSGRTNTDWYRYLSQNTAYRIAICAYKVQSGQRVYGATRLVYTATKPNIWGTNGTPSAITLNWSKIKGASGYRLYRSSSQNSGYKLVKTFSAGTSAYRITGIGMANIYIRLIPYRTVNGKKVNYPYASGTIHH